MLPKYHPHPPLTHYCTATATLRTPASTTLPSTSFLSAPAPSTRSGYDGPGAPARSCPDRDLVLPGTQPRCWYISPPHLSFSHHVHCQVYLPLRHFHTSTSTYNTLHPPQSTTSILPPPPPLYRRLLNNLYHCYISHLPFLSSALAHAGRRALHAASDGGGCA